MVAEAIGPASTIVVVRTSRPQRERMGSRAPIDCDASTAHDCASTLPFQRFNWGGFASVWIRSVKATASLGGAAERSYAPNQTKVHSAVKRNQP